MSSIIDHHQTQNDRLSHSAKWILAITLCYSFSFVSIAFLPLYMRETLHCSYLTIGVGLSLYGIGTIIASFYGATLCDKFPAYVVSCFALGTYIIGLTMIYFIAHPFWLFVITLLIMGVANAAFLPAARMLLMRYCSKGAQLRANGLRYTLYNIGCAASLALVVFFANENYHIVTLFTLSFTVIALFLLLIFVKCDGPEYRAKKPEKAEKYYFWHDPFFAVIFAGLFIGMIVFCQLTSSFSLFLSSVYQFSMHDLSMLFIINCVMIGTMQMFVINFIKRFSESFIMLLGPIFMGLGFTLLLTHVNVVTMTLCMILVTIGEMLFIPVSQNLVYQRAADHLKGYYMGIYQACYAIAVIVAPLIGATLLNLNNSGVALWLFILFISALPVCGYFYFRNKIKDL